MPAADLPSEKLIIGYIDVDDAGGLLSASQIYVHEVAYNKLGRLTQRLLGEHGERVAVTSTIGEPICRLTSTNIVPRTQIGSGQLQLRVRQRRQRHRDPRHPQRWCHRPPVLHPRLLATGPLPASPWSHSRRCWPHYCWGPTLAGADEDLEHSTALPGYARRAGHLLLAAAVIATALGLTGLHTPQHGSAPTRWPATRSAASDWSPARRC